MPVNFPIDERLLEEACAIGKHQTAEEMLTEAVREYIQRRKQVRIIDLFNTIDYDPRYDYKKQRRVE